MRNKQAHVFKYREKFMNVNATIKANATRDVKTYQSFT